MGETCRVVGTCAMYAFFLALVCISVKSAVSSIKSAAVNNDLMYKWELASGKDLQVAGFDPMTV